MSPTARALVALEMIQNSPGITADGLGERLGVSARAARRYVAILREAEVPIESVSGRHGGYRVGRGLRLAPMMFTATEALGLVMAVLEGHPYASDPGDPVGAALAKILRAVPSRVADPVRSVAGPPASSPLPVDAALLGALIEACADARSVRVHYRSGPLEVDPWAVVLRRSRWYLLCHAHHANALRVLRADRISAIDRRPARFTPPASLDALRTLEEHLSQGWEHPVEVRVEAPLAVVARWLPRSLGRLEPDGDNHTLLYATTSSPDWYARQLATLPAPFQVRGSEALRRAVADLATALSASA